MKTLLQTPVAPLFVIRNSSGSDPPCYRSAERRRILASLQANSSLLVVGESGIGKTTLGEFIAQDLGSLGFPVASTKPASAKQLLVSIATQLGVETTSLEGRALQSTELQHKISQFLGSHPTFLICDSADKYPPQFRLWLEDLLEQGSPLLLLATWPPARDIFLKLPRIELKPLSDRAIRSLMQNYARDLGLTLKPGDLANLQQRCAGNPMLAKRAIQEEYLGLPNTDPDHTQWIDGTPFLIAGIACFTVVRFLGLGFGSTSLYLLGGILTVAVGIVRLIFYSLPRKSARLGQ